MRIVRLAALLGSVLLIMGAAVGFLSRRDQLGHDRDLGVQTAAVAAAARLGAVLDVMDVAADVGGEPAAVAGATARQYPGATVCAADEPGADVACATSAGPATAPAPLARAMDASAPTVGVADQRLTATAHGEIVVGLVLDGAALVADGPSVVVAVAPRANYPADGLSSGGGRRVAVTGVAGRDDVVVVASVPGGVALDREEWTLLVVLSALALLLLGLAAATMRAEQRALLERASIDPLTRLPNRSEFERRTEEVLAAARRNGTGVCMLLFDLDGFKLINDTHGHQAGDDVLRTIGKRLRKAVRESDVVARWGGDEFVLVLPGIEDASAARSRAAGLADMIAGETIGDGLHVGASVGIAMFPRHADTLPELVEAADAAMYAAKRDGVTYRLAGVETAPLAVGLDPHADRRRSPTISR